MKWLLALPLALSMSLALMAPVHGKPSQKQKGKPLTQPAFPLKISENKRYLVDRKGTPFLYNADTAWMLFMKLTKDEAVEYLTHRKNQGFTAVQVQLTGFMGMANCQGEKPYLDDNAISHPNEAYFKHVDEVLKEAEKLGLYMALTPAWVGCCGEGWAGRGKPLQLSGPEKSRAYGRFLGKRYGKFPNLMWIMGGDNDPHEDREPIRQIALGIKDEAPRQLITYHAASSHSSTDVWPESESWLDVSMTYTYFRGFNKAWNKNQPDVYEVNLKEYHKEPARPYFLGESTYEGEHDAWGSALQARKQAYWSVLTGGMGHAYGSPNWNFPKNWREVLDLPGANSLRHLPGLLAPLPWTRLVPDEKKEVVVSGLGEYATNNYATAAWVKDGSLALVYVPTPRTLTVDLGKLRGPVTARWYDPTSGVYQIIEGSPFKDRVQRSFTPPSKNSGGDTDFVLVLDVGQ